MLICPHLCWQQFPALVLLPRPLASGHLYDVSTSHVLPCIHLSLQSRLYMHCGSACAFKKLWICLLQRKKSLELINLASPHCACRHIGSCSCFTPLQFHSSSWCYASHFFFQWLSFLWIDILQFIQVYFGVWQEEFSRFKDMAVFISRNCC